ncbi:low affinity iron permease family protein [Arthrobacter alpinus]|uniref:low affinity iron permease family protein n=1 Tax=Arthrobacter alpinus TaxID=656366 RepID=UPI000AA3F2E8|nr:low affinity iron permease family protein [Arthrobacter alpinus]
MSRRVRKDSFSKFTTLIAAMLGRPIVFLCAVLALFLWAVSGPVLGFSDTWQLIINAATTIVTFLMVFIIQNTQNRDNLAINLKLEALMLELKISNSKLYGAEDHGEKDLLYERKIVQAQTENQNQREGPPGGGDAITVSPLAVWSQAFKLESQVGRSVKLVRSCLPCVGLHVAAGVQIGLRGNRTPLLASSWSQGLL